MSSAENNTGSWHRFLQLSREEKFFFLRAWLCLPATAVALRCSSFQRWTNFLARRADRRRQPSAGSPETILDRAHNMSRLVTAAARRSLLPRNCLRESIVLWWLLRRQGISSDLRFGGRRQQGLFEAHAWVEFHGQVLNDTPDVSERFPPFLPADLPRGAEFR